MAENAPTLVLKLSPQDTGPLADIRTQHKLFVAETDEAVWLKAKEAGKDIRSSLNALPAVRTYVLQGRLLFPVGATVPEAHLPQSLQWKPLQVWLRVEAPRSVLPPLELPADKLPFRLVRSQEEKTASALLIEADRWLQYAETAPAVRLSKLRFALSEERQVLVTGTPLPAVPGRLFWQMERLLLPAGWTLEYPLLAPLLSRRMTKKPDDLVLIQLGGPWAGIPQAAFVDAQRATVRLSINA
ncbi:MAG: hypothetical protein GVY26_03475 [Bacteroidetes bacterium]|jgi:hypothetical protein|nr:hypothetical protein [Bacteroidota bacterium]